MNIKVLVGDNVIGAIQSISLLDGPPPENAMRQKLTVSRMRLDKEKMELSRLFSRNFVHTNAQRFPIQIVVEDEAQKEILRIHNAWLDSVVSSFSTSDQILLEGVELAAESVSVSVSVSVSGTFDINT